MYLLFKCNYENKIKAKFHDIFVKYIVNFRIKNELINN
jgi:hypothetical protein